MTPAPILTRWHRPTGTPRACRGCGLLAKLPMILVPGAAANWCSKCRRVNGDFDRFRMRRLLDWSGAMTAPISMTTELMEAA